jgi:spore coat protein A
VREDSQLKLSAVGGNAKVDLGQTFRSRRIRVCVVPIIAFAMILPLLASGQATAPKPVTTTLSPYSIPKYVNQLVGPPPVHVPSSETLDQDGNVIAQSYHVDMTSFAEQILPSGFPQTPVWGYSGEAYDPVTGTSWDYLQSSPGASFDVQRGVPIDVTWTNKITGDSMFAVDPTIHWADPNDMGMPDDPTFPEQPYPTYPPGFPDAQSPVPLVPHLHGGEVQSTSDGVPDEWFTADGQYGPSYSEYPNAGEPGSVIFHYPNEQPATTLWYHDHALGITRLNVMSGLAGFYILRDSQDPLASLLPTGKYDMPLVIQDRTFNTDGTFWFPSVGDNPTVHPYWMPEFFGDTIMVNGLVWPNMNVDQGVYMFRLLDGSNARFYTMSLIDRTSGLRLPMLQIGSDGGYLRAAAPMTSLTIAPGERAEILVDFSNVPAGSTILMTNSAKAPFPGGEKPDPRGVGQVMQFTVTGNAGQAPQQLPAILNQDLATFPSLPTATKQRILTLTEIQGPNGPLEILLNGQKWMADVTEKPVLGTTEEWVIVNPTADTHPIHLHLVQFQLVSRQMMDTKHYYSDWLALNADGFMPGSTEPPFALNWTPLELPIGPYLKNKPMSAPPNEQGWKDTIQMNPGEVTIIMVRFAPISDTNGNGQYPFDATYGPGYVWHCHILDHEDNEMMRPYEVVAAPE